MADHLIKQHKNNTLSRLHPVPQKRSFPFQTGNCASAVPVFMELLHFRIVLLHHTAFAMKRILFLFPVVSIQWLVAQTSDSHFIGPSQRITIKGVIRNYHPADNSKFVSIKTYDLSGKGTDTSLFISNDGHFEAQVYQPFEGNLRFSYNKGYIALYASRDEKIDITIDDAKWQEAKNKTDAMVIGGKSGAVSREINLFTQQLQNQQFAHQPDMGDKTMSDSLFAAERAAQMNEELAFLDKYAGANPLSDKKFVSWAKNNIIYSAGRDILFHCFSGKMNYGMTHHKLVTAILKDIPLNRPGAVNSAYYYSFLNLLSGDFAIIGNINPQYKDTIRQMGNSALLLNLDKTDQYIDGLARELIYLDTYNSQVLRKNNETARFIHRFKSVIKDPLLAGILTSIAAKENKFTAYNVLQKISAQPGGDSLAAKMTALFAAGKSAYIFMDFWGSWCSPCMSEMQYYSKLIDQLKDQPVTFFFMAVNTPEKEMRDIQKKYGINGKFVWLNNNEVSILNNAFGFSSYPSHYILDAKGQVLDNRIPNIAINSGVNPGLIEYVKNVISKK